MEETEYKTACQQAAALRECQVIAELLEIDEIDLFPTEE
jgi:hypothetical protein